MANCMSLTLLMNEIMSMDILKVSFVPFVGFQPPNRPFSHHFANPNQRYQLNTPFLE